MEGGYEMSGGVSCAVDLFYSNQDPLLAGQGLSQRMIGELGLGMTGVFAVAAYVERDAPHALSAQQSFSLNFDLEFDHQGLRAFLEECFPDVLAQERGQKLLAHVQPGRRYTVRTFDMS